MTSANCLKDQGIYSSAQLSQINRSISLLCAPSVGRILSLGTKTRQSRRFWCWSEHVNRMTGNMRGGWRRNHANRCVAMVILFVAMGFSQAALGK